MNKRASEMTADELHALRNKPRWRATMKKFFRDYSRETMWRAEYSDLEDTEPEYILQKVMSMTDDGWTIQEPLHLFTPESKEYWEPWGTGGAIRGS